MNGRIQREMRTVSLMIGMYCSKHHSSGNDFCTNCLVLKKYAEARSNNCQFGEKKPVCSKCPVHCFTPEKRVEIKTVMRYAGPRMIYSHPYLAIMHLIDKNRKPDY